MISSDRFLPSKGDPGTGCGPSARTKPHTEQSCFHFSDYPKTPRFHAWPLTRPRSAAICVAW